MAAYWEIAAHPAYDMFSKYKYLIVNLFFSPTGFLEWEFFLIAHFPDHCLLVPFCKSAACQITETNSLFSCCIVSRVPFSWIVSMDRKTRYDHFCTISYLQCNGVYVDIRKAK